ncbi:INO80 complex, subunit Ies4 [Aspergillus aurantiobrunneus]
MPAATSTSRANGRSTGSGASKLLVLKLSSSLLKKFSPIPDNKDKRKRNSAANTSNKKSESGADSPSKKEDAPSSPASSAVDPAPPASSIDNASDAASTPAPGTFADANRKSLPGPKPGAKRGLNPTSDSSLKPRGKPGPKKRPRLEDGTTENVRLSTSHRLGPKANTGAINAGLRALDRSGAPCRKWERKPLQLKSFTGVQWQLPSWRAPPSQKQEDNGETKEGVLETGDSDSRANQSASAVPSEKSNSGDGDLTPAHPSMVEASSPAITMVA